MAKKEITYEEIVRDVRAGNFRPVYYLMGEEAYYIDRIADYIVSMALKEEERDFNLTVLYGAETDMGTILTAARRFPVMSVRQVVVVKEAQQLRSLDDLSFYLQKPPSQTVLVFCHKNGVLDRRKKVAGEIERSGILFESKRLRDYQLPGFIAGYLKRQHLAIDEKSAALLADAVGSDLNRLAGEMEKLILSLPAGQTRVTAELIERNIGVSKEYNNFELRNALVTKDILKANRIAKYFDENQKANPIQKTLSMLFSFYSNLMLAYYAQPRNEAGVAEMLGLSAAWQTKEYLTAMKYYTARKTMNIISAIRQTDAKSKGFGNSMATNGELLRDLICYILH